MWDVRAITDDEVELFRHRLSRGFGSDVSEADADPTRFKEVFDIDRTFAAFDDGDIVGTGGAFSFGLTVRGGRTVAMGGTTIITVQPTHRRRGVLRAMMEYHLDEVASRGEPLAGLWAAEGAIYGRFGFGIASMRFNMTMDAAAIEFRDETSLERVRLLDAEAAEPIMRTLYERVRLTRPGMLTRSDADWRHGVMWDPEHRRNGRSARRYAVVFEGGEPTGYTTYRQKEKWDEFPEGEVAVIEVMPTTDASHTALWHFLTNIDLYPKVEWWNAPVDEPLPAKVTDPRQVRRRLEDALWLRVLDVPAALHGRTYERDGGLTIGVVDPFRPQVAGAYRLDVSGGEAACERTDRSPDVEFDVDVLGAIYLGGGELPALAAAGRVRGSQDARDELHRIFAADPAPWCEEVF